MSNQELIPVFAGEIAGVSSQLVDARLLHTFLESNQQFGNWIQNRIQEYEFTQDIDFIVFNNFIIDVTAFGGKRKMVDYHLTLDMAKELSMVERNAKGKQARRYFIECEKRLLAGFPEFLNPITEPITLADFNWRRDAICRAIQNLKKAQVSTMMMISGEELLAGTGFEK